MCGFIQGGPSLRVCMFAKVFQTYAKSILVQEVETMHHTDFTNNDIFHLLSGFVSRGGSSGIYAKSHQTIGKTITFGNIVDHPSFHNTCIFFCQQISLFQLLHCVQRPMNKNHHIVCVSWPNKFTQPYINPLTHTTTTRQTNINLTHTNTPHQTHHTNQPHQNGGQQPHRKLCHIPSAVCTYTLEIQKNRFCAV